MSFTDSLRQNDSYAFEKLHEHVTGGGTKQQATWAIDRLITNIREFRQMMRQSELDFRDHPRVMDRLPSLERLLDELEEYVRLGSSDNVKTSYAAEVFADHARHRYDDFVKTVDALDNP